MGNEPSPEEIEILKKIPPEQKLLSAIELYWTARKLKAAGLRMLYPDLTEEMIEKKVRDLFLYAGD